MKPRPARSVATWITTTPESLLHLSVITIGEIRKGIDLLDDNNPKRSALQSWLDHDLRMRFAGRLLPFDEHVAERWGRIEALARRQHVSMPTVDAQLAATALHHGLTFVTRNISHVRVTAVPLFDPWNVPIDQ